MGKWIVGIITFLLITFWIEPSIVNFFVSLLPASMSEWRPFLKALFWLIVFFSGLGISIVISVVIAAIFDHYV